MSLARAARSMNDASKRLRKGAGNLDKLVFISYSREDRDVVESLSDMLSEFGYSVWWDREITAGESVDDRITAALEAAIAVIVLWSNSSMTSTWVQWEANQGLKHRKLVPIALSDLHLRDIRPPFNGLSTLRIGDEAGLIEALFSLGLREQID